MRFVSCLVLPLIAVPILAPTRSSGESQRTAHVLEVLEDALPTTLSPLNPITMIDYRVLELLHDSLFRMDEYGFYASSLVERGSTGQPVFETDMNSRMNAQGVLKVAQFHDGSRVTLEDLKFSALAHAGASERGLLPTSFYSDVHLQFDSVPALGDRGFKVSLQKPLQDIQSVLTFKILPRAAFPPEKSEKNAALSLKYNQRATGLGPFKLPAQAKLSDDVSRLKLEAHTGYHLAPGPRLAGIAINAEPSGAEKIGKLRGGQAHVLVSLAKNDQSQARAAGGVVLPYFIRNWWYIGFNCRHDLLRDKKFRQALALAIDREALGRQLSEQVHFAGGRGAEQGGASRDENGSDDRQNSSANAGDVRFPSTVDAPGTDDSVVLLSGPFVPESPYYNREVPHPRFSLEAARELMKSVPGVTLDGSLQRWRYKGQLITLNLDYKKEIPSAEDVVSVIVSQLESFGIKVNSLPRTQNEWTGRTAPEGDRGKLNLTLGRWHFDVGDDLRPIIKSNGPLNHYGYSNAGVDSACERFSAPETSSEQQVQIMREIHRQVMEDLPFIPLWQAAQVAAFSPRVRGYAIHSFAFYINPHRWFLDAE